MSTQSNRAFIQTYLDALSSKAKPDSVIDEYVTDAELPDYRAKGTDAQLKKAVDELMKQMGQ